MATSSCHSEAMVTSRVFTASELLPPIPSLDAFTGIVESPVPRPSSTLPKTHDEPICHERLFHHFRGYVWTEKVKDTLSWAWDYGYDIQNMKKRIWVCHKCIIQNNPKPRGIAWKGLQNAMDHLFESHLIRAPAGKTKSQKQIRSERNRHQPAVATIVTKMGLDIKQPREQLLANTYIKNFDRTQFQRLLVEWVIASNLSFESIEDDRLRAIFSYLNPSVEVQNALISADTVRSRIASQFELHFEKVAATIRTSPGLVHFSFDGWRSSNRKSLYGVCCFFRNVKNQPCKVVLGLPELTKRHIGSNIADKVIALIDEYGLSHKVGYFTLDNADNNDTAMRVIGNTYNFDGPSRRGRCFGHILNLSAKALLFGKDSEAFEGQLSDMEALSQAEWDLWRRRGPVGKLHNIIVDIHRSDRLTNLLRDIQLADIATLPTSQGRSRKPLSVVVDNDTRWLSQLYMIRRALELRDCLDILVIKYKAQFIEENISKRTHQLRKSATLPRICKDENLLSSQDWETLQHVHTFLGFYEDAVKVLEGDGITRKRKRGFSGSYGNVWDVIQGFEFLLAKLEDGKIAAENFPGSEHFKFGINNAWMKLDSYYNMLDETPIYYAALALHPAFRWRWFEKQWKSRPDWVNNAKRKVQEVWDHEYRDREDGLTRVVPAKGAREEPPRKRQRLYLNSFQQFSEGGRERPTSQDSSENDDPYDSFDFDDEYEEWQQTKDKTDLDVGGV
ncbi:restless-like transposase [Apiospora kogelbergensis]|uniref:Restless-like transposase n=1 Tax=Apiospora kogelbergensis TaxID=1337665 RepID=A0AAW0QZ03_9PEZI